MKSKVDIIVPVYNAYESLKKCIKSVIKNTDLVKNNLIIIDDGSQDKRIFDFYSEVGKIKGKNIKVYKNEQNLGFVGTVNRGMGLNKNDDVLLLNSDTIVTKNWLNNITSCAYSSDEIATVTPLSNNATICSVPNFVQDNQLPEGFDVDSFANLISSKSLKLYPKLPTGHGFCIFIKRDILNIFGFFNLELFGKGYGEENEFCLRVEKFGYKNVLDDSTFIYHSGSASFTDEARINKVKNNIKIIETLYPGYQLRVENFVKTNPLKPIHDNINFWIKNKNLYIKDKKRILFVMHYEPTIGGVGLNVNSLASYLTDFYDFLCFRKNEYGQLSLEFFENKKWKNILVVNGCNVFENKLVDEKIEDIFKNLLFEFQIDLVHFHHLMGWPLSLIGIPREIGIPSVLSVHDYFFISKSPNFINDSFFEKVEFTSNGRRDGKALSKVINDGCSYRFNFIKEILPSLCDVVVPSLYVKDLYKELLPDVNLKLIEHGVEVRKIKRGVNLNKTDGNELNIAFLGVCAKHKGVDTFIRLINEKKLYDKKINWYLIGEIDKDIRDEINKLSKKSRLIVIGKYNLSDLNRILINDKIALVLLLSNAPETFSYTLSESVNVNIPVIANDIGALGDRVKRGDFGWVYKNYDNLVEIIENLYQRRGILIKKSNKLKSKVVKPLFEMVDEYKLIYDEALLQLKKRKKILKENNLFFYENVLSDLSTVGNVSVTNFNLKNIMKEKLKSIPFVKRLFKRLKIIFKK